MNSTGREELEIAGGRIGLGETRDLELAISGRASGAPVMMPLRVWRAQDPGPTVLLTGALHGDELNGTGIIRALLREPGFELMRGSLILVPVLNIFGFERKTRYMPDRRDLNRSFPGSKAGSLSSRVAERLFQELVIKCDYAIDFHTAAVQRTNLPNVRGDLQKPEVKRLAKAFGSELVVHGKGPEGSLRRTATESGRPMIILEAGEVWKIEPSVIEVGVRGVRNVLIELDMVEGKAKPPVYQSLIRKTKWVRAEHGGLLEFHVVPGMVVEEGQDLATCVNLLGERKGTIVAPVSGIVMGMATLPSVIPGDPVFHLAVPRGVRRIVRALEKAGRGRLIKRVRNDLATSLTMSEPDERGEVEG